MSIILNDELIPAVEISDALYKGDPGKDAYQSYVETTADNPILTEAQWANQMGNAEAALDSILLILNSL